MQGSFLWRLFCLFCGSRLLRDYARILIEKCNFAYVAETTDHQVVGCVCGKNDSHFSKILAAGAGCSSSSIWKGISCQPHSRKSLMPFFVSCKKEMRISSGNAIWSLLLFPPKSIIAKVWGHRSNSSWIGRKRMVRSACVFSQTRLHRGRFMKDMDSKDRGKNVSRWIRPSVPCVWIHAEGRAAMNPIRRNIGKRWWFRRGYVKI